MLALGRDRDLCAEMRQQPLGVVAARLVLDHGGGARRRQPGEQHRRLDLGRGHRRTVDDRHRIARTFNVSGKRPPVPTWSARAPMSRSGSSTRCIGRARSDASPSKAATIGQPATAPMTSLAPVPELPKSRAASGCAKPLTPTPRTRHSPSPVRSTRLPSARSALPVLRTSSPSSRPEMRVSPTASAPKIKARCEIDLSPGTRTRPASGRERRAVSGDGAAWLKFATLRRGRAPS